MANLNDNMMHDGTGMMLAREYLDTKTKVSFINKLLNMLINPTKRIINAMSEEKIDIQNLSMIMSIFGSIRIDVDLFNLTILEDNANTRMMQESYNRNGFYMISGSPVIDRKTQEVCILINLYKKADDDPLQILDVIKKKNAELITFIYIMEIFSIGLKDYKNKFFLANKVRQYFYENNPNADSQLANEATVAIAKLTTVLYRSSMFMENLKNDNEGDAKRNIEYLKNNMFIPYDPQYSYKLGLMGILDLLLKNVQVDCIDMKNNTQQNLFGGGNGINSKNNQNENMNNNDEESEENDNNEENDDNTQTVNRNSVYSDRSGDNDENDNENDNNYDSDNSDIENDNNQDNPNGAPITDDDSKFLKISFKNNKTKMFFCKMPPQKANSRYDNLDSMDERSIDRFQDVIDHSVQKLKGSGVGDIFQKIGMPLSIEMDWESEIIKYVDNMTNTVNSNKTECVWIKPNLYTRHMAYLPGRKPIPESIPVLYILFDQSGSMSNNIIRKINYVIQYFYKKKYDLNILVHDWGQNIDDVNIYEFRPRIHGGYSDEMSLDDLISSRVKSGGTSHKAVFDLVERYIDEVTNKDKKYNIHYVIIASDLYSDIEDIWQKYKWIKLLPNNNIIALCPEPDMKLPFGKTIYVS